jgi:hypothetical protein
MPEHFKLTTPLKEMVVEDKNTAPNPTGGKPNDEGAKSRPILQPTQANAPDPSDLSSMALSQDYLAKAGVTKLLTTVSVDKPKSQFFFRIHPDPKIPGCLRHPKDAG